MIDWTIWRMFGLHVADRSSSYFLFLRLQQVTLYLYQEFNIFVWPLFGLTALWTVDNYLTKNYPHAQRCYEKSLQSRVIGWRHVIGLSSTDTHSHKQKNPVRAKPIKPFKQSARMQVTVTIAGVIYSHGSTFYRTVYDVIIFMFERPLACKAEMWCAPTCPRW